MCRVTLPTTMSDGARGLLGTDGVIFTGNISQDGLQEEVELPEGWKLIDEDSKWLLLSDGRGYIHAFVDNSHKHIGVIHYVLDMGRPPEELIAIAREMTKGGSRK